MKKTLLTLSIIAMLIIGCNKETNQQSVTTDSAITEIDYVETSTEQSITTEQAVTSTEQAVTTEQSIQ